MNQRRSLFSRSSAMQQALAFSLATCLVLPNSAFALRVRNAGLEEKTHVTLELERRLLGEQSASPLADVKEQTLARAKAGMEEGLLPDEEILWLQQIYARGWNGNLVLQDRFGEEAQFRHSPFHVQTGGKRYGLSISSQGYQFWIATGQEPTKGLHVEAPDVYEEIYTAPNLEIPRGVVSVLTKWNAELRIGTAFLDDHKTSVDLAFALRNLEFILGELKHRRQQQGFRHFRILMSADSARPTVAVEARFSINRDGREKVYFDVVELDWRIKEPLHPDPDQVLKRDDLEWPVQPLVPGEGEFLSALGGLIGGVGAPREREWESFPRDSWSGALHNQDHYRYLYGEDFKAYLETQRPNTKGLINYLRRLTEWLYGIHGSWLIDGHNGLNLTEDVLNLLPYGGETFQRFPGS